MKRLIYNVVRLLAITASLFSIFLIVLTLINWREADATAFTMVFILTFFILAMSFIIFRASPKGKSKPIASYGAYSGRVEDNYQKNSFSTYKDDIYDQVVHFIIQEQHASTSLLQRRFGIGYARAVRIIDALESERIIGPVNGSNPRKVYIKSIDELYSSNSQEIQKTDFSKYSLESINTGEQFEYFVADLLDFDGFTNIVITAASGDQGVDILATKNQIKYAFQTKFYSTPVGNDAVQQIVAGKQFYNAHVGVLVTNNSYTKAAIDLANSTNILLWSSNDLHKLMELAENKINELKQKNE